MHPSPPAAVTVAFRDHEFTAVLFRGAPVFPGSDVEQALEYAPGFLRKQIPRWIETDLWQAGAHSMVLNGDEFAAYKAAGGLRVADCDPQNASMIRSATVLTERGLYRLLMLIGNRKIALDFQEMLETKVLPALMRTGSYSLPGADAAPRGLPTVREITGLLAELRRNKVPTTTIHGVTANLLGQIGIEFVPGATPAAPAAAQLSLPLPTVAAPAATEPEPAPKGRDKSNGKPPWVPKTPPDDGDDWSGFVRAWAAKFGHGDDVIMQASKLLGIVDDFIEVKGKNAAGRAAKLGKLLDARKYCVIAGFKIDHQNSTVRGWSLIKQ